MEKVNLNILFSEMELEVLDKWKQESIFQKQNEKRADAKEFVFYDGPPFANGLPHYGHLLANSIKDTVTRYWIMKGFKVDRRFGWDCHGLPVEFEIEKRDKLKGRPDILKMGVAKFNETCRDSVLHYAAEWQKVITRLGRWVDWDRQYRTMDKEYMESVWWVFSTLYKKGLIYQGLKVVPYSPRTTSVVSNFEANQNYKMVQDPSVFIKFKLKGRDESLICWTTTPWTLPANLALAVGPDITYVRVKDHNSGEVWILAKERVEPFYEKAQDPKEGPRYTILSDLSAQDLIGLYYEPLFPYFANENAFRVLQAGFVATSEGTGIVHQAPAFGEDDFFTCREQGITPVDPIDETGCFTKLVPDYAGLYFKDADKPICRDLKAKGLLIRHETIMHSYPFDERTDTPLMYKAVPSWYVSVEKFVDKLIKNNAEINWVPHHIKDGRMGSWLAQARDWSISRNRFWGTPLPVWVCEVDSSHLRVMGSIQELENLSKTKIHDLHSHYLQDIKLQCPHCTSSPTQMKLVDLVFDCWFESGSMPYAQMHYPFENADRFKEGFPAHFIAEGLDQTRGWFYTLHVLASALFDKPAFQNVIVNGVILDEAGKKMSKRHRNYTPPEELLEKYGADSVRLYLLNSALLRAEDLMFSDQGVKDISRLVLLPLWNAQSFLITYAVADQWKPSPSFLQGHAPKVHHELDAWLLSRLECLKSNVIQHMEAYKLYLVVPSIVDFIEDLTNWYIRLSRKRFWGTAEATIEEATTVEEKSLSVDQQAAFETLYFVLVEFSKLFSAFAPFVSDRLYQNLCEGLGGDELSVHLCDFPKQNPSMRNERLEEEMELLRQVVNQGRFLRQKHKLKVRQVLASMLVITAYEKDRAVIEKYELLLKNELNVKHIYFTTDESKHIRIILKPNLQVLGKKLGKKLPEVKAALHDMSASLDKVAAMISAWSRGEKAEVAGEYLEKADLLLERVPLDERLVSTEKGLTILLDTSLTPELLAEGRARELVNRIQNLRKESALDVSDRIQLEILGPDSLLLELESYKKYICSETLARTLLLKPLSQGCSFTYQEDYEVDDMTGRIALELVKL
ncbi:MAG: isoleucine--tRNA ligase [Oligoflexales bacterium]|nr:isoleucine--tRNA ligase [Oligoflexales bacterium]